MRRGDTAGSSDLIPLPPRWYRDGSTEKVNEGCFQQGSVLRVVYTITNNTGMPLGCVVTVSLGEVYPGGPEMVWQQTYGTPTNPRPYPAYNYVDPPAWPEFIAHLHFTFTFAFYLQKGGQWQPAGNKGGMIENFTILGLPQAPMNQPWIKVLRISCIWMRRTSTELDAQRRLTKRMFGVKYDPTTGNEYVDDSYAVFNYDPGSPAYSPNWTLDGNGDVVQDEYWLRDWLADSNNGQTRVDGQCTDVSGLWVIMATSVGGARKIQLINNPHAGQPWDQWEPFGLATTYWAGKTSQGPQTSGGPNDWFRFHQVGWADVYDASLAFSLPLPPIAEVWDQQTPPGYVQKLWNGSWDPQSATPPFPDGVSNVRPYRYRNPTLTVSYDFHP
jgi:hypothetical protein